ncbi:hypothetical protein H6P81_003986 [Aristolochia fimbriata]|uniref:Pectinesterase inhibitor domain-containing protein n=1 Tax=Aristolochia fimbriata TaxID=158543 RepID=A0AAV7FEY8_ARIFI|nr:hypothetical protein H6P81_003986 [Aristolochia fimbriata]
MSSRKGGVLFPLLLLVLVCHVFSLASASDADIQKACAATDFPADCVAFLKGEPGSLEADLRGLAKIALHLSQRNASDTFAAMGNLAPVILHLDPRLRVPLGFCLQIYPGGVLDSIQTALKAIDDGDFNLASTSAAACGSRVTDCEKTFKEMQLTSPLKQQDCLQIKLCTVACELAVQLDH